MRTLNYLGCKFKLLDFIEEQVERVTPKGGGVCDLFAGSGCVAYKLSEHFQVTACDIQYYSKVICDALLQQYNLSDDRIAAFLHALSSERTAVLEDVFSPLLKEESDALRGKRVDVLADIIEHGSMEVFAREMPRSLILKAQEQVLRNLRLSGLKNNETFISRHYGGVYFSYRQAIQIDVILSAIRELLPECGRTIFLAALLSTASDIVDTVGKHFAQPIKARNANGSVKSLVYNKAVRDKTLDVKPIFEGWVRRYASLPRGMYSHRTINGDFMDCLQRLPKDVATVYADPPYTRDHYSRFYHVLETIARGDTPDISTVNVHGIQHISNGLYRKDRHQSPFCIRSKAPSAFDSMFRTVSASGRNLLLSYSPYDDTKKTHPRVVTMDLLVSLAKRYFTHMDVVSAGKFAHNKLNSTAHLLEASDEAELLIVCTGAA